MHGMSLSGFSWVPLASVTESSEVAKGINSKLRKRIEDKAKAGLLPPGLKEQYDLQLEELEMRGYGDCEIIHFPSFFGSVGGKSKRTFFSGSVHEMKFRSAPEDGKAYISAAALLNHPFSRGTIVSLIHNAKKTSRSLNCGLCLAHWFERSSRQTYH